MRKKEIDGGKAFDWGRTSEDYAKYRDIYPPVFYQKIAERNLCVRGQKALDLGTGTGVLPRNMYSYGARWIGTDLSEEQIAQAKRLTEEQGMKIRYLAAPAEDCDFPENEFDVVTACQCFWYFDYEKLTPVLSRILKRAGSFLMLYMAWLPYEDKIAAASEELVLEYSPGWTGARETWNGRMKACRGVGASLSSREIQEWEKRHRTLLEEIAPEHFRIQHYAAMAELKPKR